MDDVTTDIRTDEPAPDDFDLAFDAIISEGDSAEPETPSAEIEEPTEDESTDTADEGADGADDSAKDEDSGDDTSESADSDEEADDDGGEPPAPSVDEIADKAAAKLKEENERKTAKDAEEKAAREAEEKAKADADARQASAQYTEDEQELLESVESDFPVVRQALAAQERVLTAKFNNELMSALNSFAVQLQQHLDPVFSSVQNFEADSFDTVVLGKHDDAYDILPKVEEWVPTQPKILQDAYNKILDKGTAEQTVELLDAYKAAVGSTPSASKEKSEAVKAKEAEAAAKKKAAKEDKLAGLEGVTGKATPKTSTAVDPDDFDGAFDKFANA